jgi:hypothetical protein
MRPIDAHQIDAWPRLAGRAAIAQTSCSDGFAIARDAPMPALTNLGQATNRGSAPPPQTGHMGDSVDRAHG